MKYKDARTYELLCKTEITNINEQVKNKKTKIIGMDKELKWAPGTFRSSMLWSDRFYFEIAENEAFLDKIEKLDTTGNWNFDILKNKINELIDIVNEIQNKDQ